MMSLCLHAVHCDRSDRNPSGSPRGRTVLLKEIELLKHLVRTPVRILLPVVLLLAGGAAEAQEPQAPEQREHLVRRGDTLWDLARAYLENPFLWRMIYDANRDVVENPHWIYPAERLIIPPLLARDAPGSTRREPLGDPLGTPLTVELNEERMPPPMVADSPTVVETVDLRRPAVALSEYLSAPWLSTTAPRQVSGTILRMADPAATRDRLASNIHPNDRVHIGDMGANRPQVGDSLSVVRFGRQVANLGVIVEPLAVLLVEAVDPTTATARVVRQFGTARLGDSVILLGPLPQIGMGEPEPVQTGPEGQLLEFLMDEALYGPTDIAFISIGRANGVGIGDEFAVYVPARGITGQAERLPPETVGTVRVVRVEENTATVRVRSVNNAALANGLPVHMIRKMP
jgi:hypothetical protein